MEERKSIEEICEGLQKRARKIQKDFACGLIEVEDMIAVRDTINHLLSEFEKLKKKDDKQGINQGDSQEPGERPAEVQ